MSREPRIYGTGTIVDTRGRWRARLPDAHGRRTVGTFDSYDDAAAALLEELEKLEGVPTPRGKLAGAYGSSVLAARAASGHYKAASVAKDVARWRVYVLEDRIAEIPVVDLDAGDVRQWLRRLLTRGLAGQTVSNAITTLRAVMRRAVEDDLRTDDPTAGVRLPKGARARTDAGWDWLRAGEIDALLDALDDRVRTSPRRLLVRRQSARAIVTVAIFSGLRAGEIWGLPWDRVDLDAGRISVTWSYDDAPKAGLRTVPILAPVREALERWRTEGSSARSRRDLVFPSYDGGTHSEGFDAGLHDALRAAGVTRAVRFHDLRHTCASHLLQGTWSPEFLARRLRLEEVRDWLGHSDITVTQRYAHLSADAIQELVQPSRSGHVLATNLALPRGFEPRTNGLGSRRPQPETPSGTRKTASVARLWPDSPDRTRQSAPPPAQDDDAPDRRGGRRSS